MQDHINLSTTAHDMGKTNLVTLKGGYDLLTCTKCGASGRRYGLTESMIVNGVKRLMLESGCVRTMKRTKWPTPTASADLGSIIVTNCTASNPAFKNITPDSTHKIINPPNTKPNDANWHRGVWVQGIGEPVMLLLSEFKQV